jgi:glycosyltransferase Alg8
VTLIAYLVALLLLLAAAPDGLFDSRTRDFLLLLGLIGTWRYAWVATHIARAAIYRTMTFPRLRHAAEQLTMAAPPRSPDAGPSEADRERSPRDPRELFIVITSYRIRVETTAAMLRAVVSEAVAAGRPTTIVMALVEVADQRLVKLAFHRLAPPEWLRLVLVRLPGEAKRRSLAVALRAVSRSRPLPGSLVALMDGDTILSPGTLRRCTPFFDLLPRLGGLTTDEDALVVRGSGLLHAWFRLRFAQRHLLMSSLGLSRRLLAMTGRFSLFSADVATDPSFIDRVENDHLDHWRLGRVPLLTGDDKSTWLWLLERDREMLYVPDVRVVTVEEPPARSLMPCATRLMLRWFGNMLRASGRALALGPRRLGLFFWWCLVDQRLSMWTPLIGPIGAVLLSITVSPIFLYAYLVWVGITRLVLALALLTVRPTIHGSWPLLIYLNQVYGALVKTWVLFNLDRQRWTRQNIELIGVGGPLVRVGSWYLHILALAALSTGVALLTGVLPLPGSTPFR